MPNFDEDVFVHILTSRPEDSKYFSLNFDSTWIENKALVPIVDEIYSFVKEFKTCPSLPTLSKVLKDKDEEIWKLRYETILEDLSKVAPDTSEILYNIKLAKDVAIVRSFQELASRNRFLEAQSDFDGPAILKSLHTWMNKFVGSTEEETLNIKEAIDCLVLDSGLNARSDRIPTGINPIDDFTGGGLRTRQLGIIMAPTGHGKSACLMNIAYKVAEIEEQPTWFITNELTMAEQTERFLSRMTATDIKVVQDNPVYAYKDLEVYWKRGLDNRLRITSVNKQISTNDIEHMMLHWAQLTGWKPSVISLDFMERMKPNDTGYDRGKEWIWLEAIARDLVRFSKRHNILIWTAVQTNRSGLTSESLDLSHGQGSIRQFQEAASVISIRKSIINGDEEVLEFKPQKMRHSKLGNESKFIKVNLKTMHISNQETKPIIVNEDSDDGKDKQSFKVRKSKSNNKTSY